MNERRQLIALLLCALAARFLFLLFSGAPSDALSDDGLWYLQSGADLLRAAEPGPLHTAPLYLVFTGLFATLLPQSAAIVVIKWVQAILSTLTVGMVYYLGRRIWDHRVGMVAGMGLALGPAFVIDSAAVVTEPLFMFLLFAALACCANLFPGGADKDLALVGVLLGLATLTRAVLLAFPAALVIYLFIQWDWRRALRSAIILLLAFGLTLLPWTVYNLIKWERFVIAGEGFASFLFFGAQEQGWTGPAASDEALGMDPANPNDRDYAGRAVEAIGADPVGWVWLRLRNLGEALLQPHNTAYYPGESLKAAAARWLGEDRSWDGLVALMQSESFWPKLAFYVCHFAALIGGLAGMVLARRRWRDAFLLYAAIGYLLAVHLVIYAIPRYLFPAEPVWWLFAASALVWAWERVRMRTLRHTSEPAGSQGA
ncbi:MAG: glycosyltransferase family 39 protein [Anaerolineae bacterium]|nr:glycosyltransferase family 39 protein [Anaerolineae bacterium]